VEAPGYESGYSRGVSMWKSAAVIVHFCLVPLSGGNSRFRRCGAEAPRGLKPALLGLKPALAA
jgi:hypothetical protein